MERLELRTGPSIVVEAASQTEVAVPDAAGEPAAAPHACACTCDESQKTEGKWPSERWAEGWNYYEKQAPPTEKFVQDRYVRYTLESRGNTIEDGARSKFEMKGRGLVRTFTDSSSFLIGRF